MNKEAVTVFIEGQPINNRIPVARLGVRYTKLCIVQVYAQETRLMADDEKTTFYDQQVMVMSLFPHYDLKMVMGDFNAQVGSKRDGWSDILGPEATCTLTDNSERLLNFRRHTSIDLVVAGSLFQHINI